MSEHEHHWYVHDLGDERLLVYCTGCSEEALWSLDEVEHRYLAHDALVAALEEVLPLLNEFEGQSYGLFHGGDPRDFSPDTECCTHEEITRWEQACAEWEAGNGTDRGPGCATFGDASAWTGSGFGVGTTTRIQPEIERARAALRLARGEAS